MAVRDLIEAGELPVLRPRNLAQLVPAYMPLKPRVWYRTSWDPRKGHLAYPNSDYSWCGLGLCPPEDPDFGINTGWDEVWWFVEDDRASSTHCKPCLDADDKWRAARRDTRSLPTDSPVTKDEWAKLGEEKMKPLNALEERKWQMLLARLNAILPMEEVTGE